MTLELGIALAGGLFGAGGSWAVQVFRTSTVSEGVKDLRAELAGLREAIGDLPTRHEHDEMRKQVCSLQSHLGDVREDVAELRGAASRR